MSRNCFVHIGDLTDLSSLDNIARDGSYAILNSANPLFFTPGCSGIAGALLDLADQKTRSCLLQESLHLSDQCPSPIFNSLGRAFSHDCSNLFTKFGTPFPIIIHAITVAYHLHSCPPPDLPSSPTILTTCMSNCLVEFSRARQKKPSLKNLATTIWTSRPEYSSLVKKRCNSTPCDLEKRSLLLLVHLSAMMAGVDSYRLHHSDPIPDIHIYLPSEFQFLILDLHLSRLGASFMPSAIFPLRILWMDSVGVGVKADTIAQLRKDRIEVDFFAPIDDPFFNGTFQKILQKSSSELLLDYHVIVLNYSLFSSHFLEWLRKVKNDPRGYPLVLIYSGEKDLSKYLSDCFGVGVNYATNELANIEQLLKSLSPFDCICTASQGSF